MKAPGKRAWFKTAHGVLESFGLIGCIRLVKCPQKAFRGE